MSEIVTHYRNIGDRRTPIGATIVDSTNTAINLTGMTVAFRLTQKSDGDIIINGAAATVVSASAGTVQYSLTADDITAIGTEAIECYGWFIVTSGGLSDKHPVGRKFSVIFEEAE